MSSHDARYEDGPHHDDRSGATTTRTDPESEAREAVLDGGPVLLPVDPPAEPINTDARQTAPDSAPVTIVDSGDPVAAGTHGRSNAEDTTVAGDEHNLDRADFSTDSAGTTSAGGATRVDSTGRGNNVDHTGQVSAGQVSAGQVSAGQDSADQVGGGLGRTDRTDQADSTGRADRVGQADPSVTALSSDSAEPTVGPETESGALKDPVPDAAFTASAATHSDWLELQGRFVDDPQGAVRDAGALVEAALAELRSRIETGSTEDLRTAFRRYRELHLSLK
jgi:hypothetical protein